MIASFTGETIRGQSMGTPIVTMRFYIKYLCHLLITFAIAKCLDPDQARHFVGPDQDLKSLQKLFDSLIVFLIVFLIFFLKKLIFKRQQTTNERETNTLLQLNLFSHGNTTNNRKPLVIYKPQIICDTCPH